VIKATLSFEWQRIAWNFIQLPDIAI